MKKRIIPFCLYFIANNVFAGNLSLDFNNTANGSSGSSNKQISSTLTNQDYNIIRQVQNEPKLNVKNIQQAIPDYSLYVNRTSVPDYVTKFNGIQPIDSGKKDVVIGGIKPSKINSANLNNTNIPKQVDLGFKNNFTPTQPLNAELNQDIKINSNKEVETQAVQQIIVTNETPIKKTPINQVIKPKNKNLNPEQVDVPITSIAPAKAQQLKPVLTDNTPPVPLIFTDNISQSQNQNYQKFFGATNVPVVNNQAIQSPTKVQLNFSGN